MPGELMTVAEFAAACHLSKQHVYRMCSNKLSPFITMENGQKMINSDALTTLQPVITSDDKTEHTETHMLQATIDNQAVQIDILNNHINALQAELTYKNEQLQSADARLRDALDISLNITSALNNRVPLLAEPVQPVKKLHFWQRKRE